MAQKTEVIVHLIDDIDGGTADQTILYGYDGKQYEIDLSTKNAKKLLDALTAYVPHSRQVRTSPKNGKRLITQPTGVDPQAVRAWCAANGIEVNSKGKIPNAIVEQYRAAGN